MKIIRAHELKLNREYFTEVLKGNKTAELRKDDRDYRIGDKIILKEWLPRKKTFTGRVIVKKITHITWISQWVPGSEEGWAVLSMRDWVGNE